MKQKLRSLQKNLRSNKFVCLWAVVLLTSCAQAPTAHRSSSQIDSTYQLQRIETRVLQYAKSPSISLYQAILSRALGSQCTFFPNDSRYAQLVIQSCGGGKGVTRAMSRFYSEPDAPALGYSVFKKGSMIYFKDLPDQCGWF